MTKDEALIKIATVNAMDYEYQAWAREALAQSQQAPMNYYRADAAGNLERTDIHSAQPEQESVAYDKTEMNCFVQDLYDKKMQEGKHGHYETMFHVVHQAIKRIPPQRTWVGLTDEDFLEACQIAERGNYLVAFQRIQAKLRSKNESKN